MPDTGFSRSPKLQKGALVQLSDSLGIPLPTIIPFQYNPESLSRTLTPWTPQPVSDTKTGGSEDNGASPSDPQETISVQELHLDASDGLEDEERVAEFFGVGDRIAAIENLLFPGADPFSTVAGAIGQAANALGIPFPAVKPKVPVTLFIWGIGRIVPVLITEYSIEEQHYLPSLRPLRAVLSITMQVQRPEAYKGLGVASQEIAKAAYKAHRIQQQASGAVSQVAHLDQLRAILPF